MWRPLLVVVLASGAEAFAPASSLAGLQCKRLSRSAVSAETRPSLRTVAHARSLKMSLGLNDKSSGTSVDEFRKDGKVLTLLEKERLYLESCAVWNVEQTKIISDEDYETLKEDLEYEGSEVILMTREEIKYLVASMRYNQGKPIMEDAEYNALQTKLRKQGSLAVKHESASCKILDDGKRACKADLYADDGKNALLYSPALVLSALLFNEWAFWFKGWDPIISLLLGSPLIAAATYTLTNFIYFQQPYITKTVCPDCGTPQNIFFGDVLFVSGKPVEPVVNTKCVNKDCGIKLVADRDTMRVEAIFEDADAKKKTKGK